MFIVAIEGIDGAGKTTIANLLKDHIQSTRKDKKVILTQEPFTKEITDLIARTEWKDPITLALLFTADRAYHLNWIKSQNPDIVILDRYYYSTIAYQSALGLDKEWIMCINSKFPKPDITILLDVDPKVSIRRIREKDLFNFEEKVKSLEKVRNIYLELAKTEKNFYVIDTTYSGINEVIKRVIEIVDPLIP
ncbi:MAG: dTMP kinase [Sulfolobaceae archaeon]|nr:dTMP kinase [Sulfolobaceae archaeon]